MAGVAAACTTQPRLVQQLCTHQLPYVLAQLDVDATIVEAQLQQLVGAALVAGVQLLLVGFLVTLPHCIQGPLVVCNSSSEWRMLVVNPHTGSQHAWSANRRPAPLLLSLLM